MFINSKRPYILSSIRENSLDKCIDLFYGFSPLNISAKLYWEWLLTLSSFIFAGFIDCLDNADLAGDTLLIFFSGFF